MRLLARFTASLALVLAHAAPAWAQISAEQRAALSARIESFNAAVKGNDMAGVMTALPPKLLEKIASTYGVTTEQLLEAMQAEVATALAGVEIVSFGMDLGAAEFVTQADGTTYALIPTETVVNMGEAGGKM